MDEASEYYEPMMTSIMACKLLLVTAKRSYPECPDCWLRVKDGQRKRGSSTKIRWFLRYSVTEVLQQFDRNGGLTGQWRGGVGYLAAAGGVAHHQAAIGAEAAQEPGGAVVAALAAGLLALAARAGAPVPAHLEPAAESLRVPVLPPSGVLRVGREGVLEHRGCVD